MTLDEIKQKVQDVRERVGFEAQLLYEQNISKSTREKLERAPSQVAHAARDVAENVSRGSARVNEKAYYERTGRSDAHERHIDAQNSDRRAAEKQATRAARDKKEQDMLDDVAAGMPDKKKISAVADGSYRKPPAHGQETPQQHYEPAPRPDSAGSGKFLGWNSAPRWAGGRGVSSMILPNLGNPAFRMGGSPVPFGYGSSIAHGYSRGSAIEFGRGTAVDVARMVGFSGSGLGISMGRGLPFNVGSGLGFGSGLARLGQARFGLNDGRLEMFKPFQKREGGER